MGRASEVAPVGATDGTSRALVRGGLVLMLAKLVHTVAGFGLYFFLSALMDWSMGADGVAAFGVYGTALVIINPLNMMFAQGTLQLVSRTVAAHPDDPDGVFRACVRVQVPFVLLFCGAFELAAPWVAEHLLNDASYTGVLRVGGLVPVFYAVRCLFQGWCNGTRRFREQSWLDMGSSTLRMALVLAGAALGWGALGALVGFVAAAAIMMLVAMAWLRPGPGVAARSDDLSPRALLGFQAKVLAAALATFLLMSLDQIAVKAVAHADPAVTDRLAAYFTGCLKIAQIPWGLVTALVWVLFPLVARPDADGARRRTLRQGFRLVLLLLAPVAAILAANPHETYALVFGSKARLAAEVFGDGPELVSGPLAVLAWGYLVNGLLVVAGLLLTAEGRPGVSLLVMGGTLGLCRWLTLSLAASHGPMGAATGSLLAWSVGLAAALCVLALRHGAVWSPATLGRIGLATITIFGLGRGLHASGLGLLLEDGLLALTYLALLLLLREVSVGELRGLVSALRGGGTAAAG